ncbi:MAG: phospholipase D family protein [Zoogloeaceae bacterium]|nr:phospholipase D family protein [Zoogloeaceae bacterium]
MILAATFSGEPARGEPLPATGSREALFAPWDPIEPTLLDLIRAARHQIRVQAYAFTSREIAEALVGAHRRGVDVAVLADAEMNRRPSGNRIPNLLAAGIPVAFETRYNAAHNKVLLIDANTRAAVIVTGSYNFTWSARERNAENVLIVRGDRSLAARYLANWERHRADAIPIHQLPFVP